MDPGSLLVKGLGELGSVLSTVIGDAMKKTWFFKSELTKLKKTIDSMNPVLNQIEKLNEELDLREETEKFRDKFKEAEVFIKKCERINWEFYKKTLYAYELEELNTSLVSFFQFYVTLVQVRDGKKTFMLVNDLKKIVEKIKEKERWMNGVPLPKGIVIGFDDRVRVLKGMVLKDPVDDDCSVVVVSAAGGFGKTTLVKMLCDDPQIKGKFGSNIYYVTISKTPNLKVVIKKLLNGQETDYSCDEDAINQWGVFLRENKSDVLLVLDDVWSDTILMDFKFTSSRYTILVTSRTTLSQSEDNIYKLQPLNDQDATKLFCCSAFSKRECTDIPDDLVDKLVMCCKNHPLALSVIGGLLKGKPLASWQTMSNELSEGKQSVWDMHEYIKSCLEKSLKLFDEEPEIKQCFLDLGLFPEDKMIAATSLMDIWVHLYKHDEKGSATLDKLFKLSSKNLANLLPVRRHLHANANHCEEESVTQHDMMRRLAIRLSKQGSDRFIINPDGKDPSQLPETVNARLLSISTDEILPLTWNEIQAAKVEVFVLNFLSKIHPLPQFMQNMESLKVLIITNYGYNFSELENFPTPQYLTGLTSIRLDHVSVSSISTSILELEKLQKLSLIMCKIGNSFNEETVGIHNKLTSLLEIQIDSCDDLVTFPAVLCNLVCLRKLSITNCHELISLHERFGNLTNLEVLRLASCLNLTALPESLKNLKKLRIIDLSHCIHLSKLPVHIGQLRSLQTIDVRSCTELSDLPELLEDLHPLKVFCDEEISHQLSHLTGVEVKVVEEDRLRSLSMIIRSGYEN